MTTDIPNGRLTNIIRSKDITIATKSNEEVQENRQFTIVIEDTSADFNSPLVKLRAGVLSVIIDDNDICMYLPAVSIHYISIIPL